MGFFHFHGHDGREESLKLPEMPEECRTKDQEGVNFTSDFQARRRAQASHLRFISVGRPGPRCQEGLDEP